MKHSARRLCQCLLLFLLPLLLSCGSEKKRYVVGVSQCSEDVWREKLNEELAQVVEALEQYKDCMETLKEKERQLKEQIELEQLKSVMALLDEQGMTVADLKEMLEQGRNTQQSA